MTDDTLTELWTTLEPADRRRIDAQVFEWLEARDTSLAAEWLQLFRIDPLPALGLSALSAVSLMLPLLAWGARSGLL